MARMTTTVGRLACEEFRDFLQDCKFKGANITWQESSGLLERKFTVEGDADHVKKIYNRVKEQEIDSY